jgi:Holliday junction resolvasome RuvABC DNA-binding subunit
MSETIYVTEDNKRRKATAEEIAQFEKDRADFEAEQSRIEAEQQAKEEAKASAMAKLSALGLSEEEVQAIIGV